MNPICILHLEDNPDDANLIHTILKHSEVNFEIRSAENKEKFEKTLLEPEVDLVLSDYTLPNYNGMAALLLCKEKRPELPFILLSATIGDERLVEMFKAGLTDFILKKNSDRVLPAINRAIKEIEEKNKRKAAEKKLLANEKTVSSIFSENLSVVLWQTSPDLKEIIYASPAFEQIWGRTVQELDENPMIWAEAIIPEDQARVNESFLRMATEIIPKLDVEFQITKPDGELRTILSTGTLLKDENKKIIGLIGVATDVTEREKLHEKIKMSLIEKESMLKEIYHRVKNNLQVVSSLLNLQAKTITDPVSKKIFIESSARIKSMALVHEMLYRSGDLSQIEIGDYVKKLSKNLSEIYHINSGLVKLIIDADSVKLNLEDAIPCGLIINELISNAFKYAFKPDQPGEIKLSIKKNIDTIVLTLSDNGVGIPTDFNIEKTTTLGMQLIHSLAKQLGGGVSLDRSNGTSFTLTFPVKV